MKYIIMTKYDKILPGLVNSNYILSLIYISGCKYYYLFIFIIIVIVGCKLHSIPHIKK